MKKGEKNETEEMELGGNFSGICAGVYSDVAFHSELPFIALFRLVHFRISGFLCILGGAGSMQARHGSKDIGILAVESVEHVQSGHCIPSASLQNL